MNKRSECKNVSLLLSEYIDNQLDEGTGFQVSAHLTECKSCFIEFENLTTVRRMVKDTYQQSSASFKVDIASKVMSRVKVAKPVAVEKGNPPKFGRYFVYAATTLLVIFSTIIYTQNKNKELMADKSKYNTYAMEHANTVYDDSIIQNVQFSRVNVNVGR